MDQEWMFENIVNFKLKTSQAIASKKNRVQTGKKFKFMKLENVKY